jgi:hypothetical protein
MKSLSQDSYRLSHIAHSFSSLFIKKSFIQMSINYFYTWCLNKSGLDDKSFKTLFWWNMLEIHYRIGFWKIEANLYC